MVNLLTFFTVPFISAFLMALAPNQANGKLLKGSALILSLVPLLMLLLGINELNGATLNFAWFHPLSIHFFLKIDTLSLVFLFLLAIVVPYSLLISCRKDLAYPATYYALILLTEALLIGFFAARDLVLFTFFYEAMLLPIYFLISYWGKEGGKEAALKFLVYMIGGSVFLLAGLIVIYLAAGTFDMDLLQSNASLIENLPYAAWLFAGVMLAFAVKTPLFPFHAWLPDAYYKASSAGTILLAAILSKAGIYGFFRVGKEIFPAHMERYTWVLLGLAIAGVLYGALSAWRQTDYKRMIAYSSFSHVNFILCGVFALSAVSHTGAVIQSVNHGITILALFIVAWWLEKRIATTSMETQTGLAATLPKLCWFTLFFVVSSAALPGLNNFVGEVLIFFGLFTQNMWLTALLGTSIILSVIYMLRWMRKMYFGEIHKNPPQNDLSTKEVLILLPLVALMLWIGLYPMPILNHIEQFFKLGISNG